MPVQADTCRRCNSYTLKILTRCYSLVHHTGRPRKASSRWNLLGCSGQGYKACTIRCPPPTPCLVRTGGTACGWRQSGTPVDTVRTQQCPQSPPLQRIAPQRSRCRSFHLDHPEICRLGTSCTCCCELRLRTDPACIIYTSRCEHHRYISPHYSSCTGPRPASLDVSRADTLCKYGRPRHQHTVQRGTTRIQAAPALVRTCHGGMLCRSHHQRSRSTCQCRRPRTSFRRPRSGACPPDKWYNS